MAAIPPPELAQETVVAILRTADAVRRRVGARLDPIELTGQQYNVLRILRGAHPEPLPTLEIGERMIEAAPGVTRLVDRLEGRGLVRRDRSSADRRVVLCSITDSGLALLERADPEVDQANREAVAALGPGQARQLLRHLETIRRNLC